MISNSIDERRQQTHKLAEELLDKRQQLWNLRDGLLQIQPYRTDQPIEPLVERFCEELIDYISLEHFGIFHHLLNGTERDHAMVAVAEEIYPELNLTTDAALDFNDKCEAYTADELRRELPGDLSNLADALSQRIALEDRLIERMQS